MNCDGKFSLRGCVFSPPPFLSLSFFLSFFLWVSLPVVRRQTESSQGRFGPPRGRNAKRNDFVHPKYGPTLRDRLLPGIRRSLSRYRSSANWVINWEQSRR